MTETKKDDIFKDLSEKGKEILSKHLDGRIYKESKICEWINLILNDSEIILKTNILCIIYLFIVLFFPIILVFIQIILQFALVHRNQLLFLYSKVIKYILVYNFLF